MALQDILASTGDTRRKLGLSEERIIAIIPQARSYIAFWREYPDLMIDFMAGPNSTFKLYFYQRVFLRSAIRHKYVFATFPRAYSKSFLAMMILMIRCILHPRAKLFVTSGGKEQAAGIIREKVQEICNLIPAFEKEIDYRPKKSQFLKDYIRVQFKNGSYFDNIAARETSRGKRRHGGVVEECVGVDGTILTEVIIPTMNISRLCMDGTTQPDETLNKSQLYLTTAGWKNTYPYNKLIQLLVWQIVKPEKSIIMGGTYRIPVLMSLLDKGFIKDLQMDGTFNEGSFSREYESKWSGVLEDAFFSSEVLERHRVLFNPEHGASGRGSKDSYYVVSADVGRKGCDTVACIFKVTPQTHGVAIKSLVNMYTFSDCHFEDQSIALKKLYYKYKARRLVLDANGMGIGLVDYLIKSQVDPDTNETLPDFGILNDPENYYRKYRSPICEIDGLYLIKASAPMNTEAHAYVQSQIASGKIKLLVDEKVAKAKMLTTKVGQNMTPEARTDYLKPFILTSILREELLNLREETEGTNIILKQSNRGVKKDKFSAFEYGLYYIKKEEEDTKNKRTKKFNAKDWCFLN